MLNKTNILMAFSLLAMGGQLFAAAQVERGTATATAGGDETAAQESASEIALRLVAASDEHSKKINAELAELRKFAGGRTAEQADATMEALRESGFEIRSKTPTSGARELVAAVGLKLQEVATKSQQGLKEQAEAHAQELAAVEKLRQQLAAQERTIVDLEAANRVFVEAFSGANKK